VSQWVGVHGIGQKFRGRDEMLQKWTSSLTDAVEWATKRRIRPDLDLAFYGHLFRAADFPDYALESRAKGPLDTDSEAWLAALDDAELADLEAAVAEIVTPAEMAATAAEAGQRKAVTWLPERAVTLAGAVERRFPKGTGKYFLRTVREAHRYLVDERLKEQVDEVTAEVAAGATVLIGHSLGSVVAYEFLRRHSGHSVKMLLTLGSPLGLRTIRDRLPAGDPNVPEWVNIRDPHDPVTAAGALSRWYPVTREPRGNNGFDAHSAERYLNFKKTGEALKDFLPEDSQ
jgi:hypothetical protein